MKDIDVSDLPESVARAIETVVHTVRQQLQNPAKPLVVNELPCWDGEVIGTLSREEIYDDGL
jgi:hypothetical protein